LINAVFVLGIASAPHCFLMGTDFKELSASGEQSIPRF
jgi:hypothetical protein